MMKSAGECVVHFLVNLFNVSFDEGLFPDNWTESIIFPLFEEGTVNDPNKYRGISLYESPRAHLLMVGMLRFMSKT